MADCNDKSSASSMAEEDHERAYFDSADWVLGKQAANNSARAAIESLKPKLKSSLENLKCSQEMEAGSSDLVGCLC